MTIDAKTLRTFASIAPEQWEAILAIASIKPEHWEAILTVAQKMVNNPSIEYIKENYVQDIEDSPRKLEKKVRDLLKEIGISPHLLGYEYLVEAIILVYNDRSYINQVTKKLYPEIAKKYHTTVSRTERAIRHAIEFAFDNGDVDAHDKIFKGVYSPLSGKPTSSQAIATLVEYLKMYI